MATEINWDAPIEAVHNDGRVLPAILKTVDTEETRPELGVAYVSVEGLTLWYRPDGKANIQHNWTIRNVASPTPDERAVAPELVARLVELARSVATSPACTILQTVEAQNILAALEPVDRVEARRLAGIWEIDKEAAYQILARGRQLEKEGK